MKIDAHQHFWQYNASDYGWITDDKAALRADFGPAELLPLLRNIGMDGTVAVQARRMAEETDYLLRLADEHRWILGVVGWLDFTSDTLESEMEQYASRPRLKGLRELIHDMPDDKYAMSSVHLNAVGLLGRYGLTYDLLIRPRHIEAAARLVDRFPDQRFVVDHIAKPDIAAGHISPWRERITELSRRPNVCCKLSGMVTEADWSAWSPEQLFPYIDVCLEAFGPSRLMIGSDWPVCTLAGSYEAVMGSVIEYVKRLRPDEQDAILGGTCAAFYGLEAGENRG